MQYWEQVHFRGVLRYQMMKIMFNKQKYFCIVCKNEQEIF